MSGPSSSRETRPFHGAVVSVPALELADAELALAGPTGEDSVLLEGERGSVRVLERGGLDAAHLDGQMVAAGLRIEAGVAVNLVVSPAALRRERVTAGASLEETLVLPPRLPLLALQLRRADRRPGERDVPEPVHGVLTLLPEARSVRWTQEGSRLVAVDDDHPEATVVLALSPGGDEGTDPSEHAAAGGAGSMEAEAGEAGGIRVRFVLPDGTAPTLLLARSDSGAAGADPLAPAAHLTGHARMAAAAPSHGVRLHTGVGALDSAVDWARLRLAFAAWRRGGPARPWGLVWTGLGAQAVGDGEAAQALLDRLAREVESPVGPRNDRHPLALPPGPLPVLLAARHALSLGDAGPALRQAERVDVEAVLGEEMHSEPRLVWSLALETLADALRWSAGEDEANRFRRAAARLASHGGATGGGGVRLPMAGSPGRAGGSAGAAAALHRLLGGNGSDGGAAPPPLEPWATLLAGRSTEGYTLWRAALARGIELGPAGRGTWDEWRAEPEAPRTGLVLATLVHGLLGWAPDAPVGRARLAPRLPEHVTRFAASGLRVGEATLSMEYTREEDAYRFRLEPTGGRAPVTLVFEPLLAVSEVTEASLDGEPVELDPREGPGGCTVPLQIPLDGPRTVTISGPGGERRIASERRRRRSDD